MTTENVPAAPIQDVPLARATRLLNHGPTVLVSARAGDQVNAMAAAWNMALDFSPPKVAVVLDKATHTRALIEASGEFVLSVPCRAQAALTLALGSQSERQQPGKLRRLAVPLLPSSAIAAPGIGGAIAWLECRVIPEPSIQTRYDLFLAEVVAARADARVYRDGRWRFDDAPDELRSLHYVAGGQFLTIGAALDAGERG